MALMNRLDRMAGARFLRRGRGWPKAAEPNRVLDHYLAQPDLESLEPIELEESRNALLPYFGQFCRIQGGPRLLLKVVGRPVRVQLLAGLCARPQFVDIRRDLKATVSSLLLVDFYQGWGDLSEWTWDRIPEEWLEFHRETGASEAVGVAIGLKLNRLEIERQLDANPECDPLVLPYSDFIREPRVELERLFAHLRLDAAHDDLDRLALRVRSGQKDEKWKSHLTPAECERLDAFEEKFGY